MRYTSIAKWMSPNTVSIIGVIFSLAAARLVFSDSLRVRQLGVLLFKVRDYVDSLDGYVARFQRDQVQMIVETGTMGYYFDGVCDGFSVAFLFFAIFFYFYKHGMLQNHIREAKVQKKAIYDYVYIQ